MTRPTTAPLPMQVQSLLPSAAETRMAMGMFAPDGPLRNGDGYYPTKPMSKNNKYKTRLKFSKIKSKTKKKMKKNYNNNNNNNIDNNIDNDIHSNSIIDVRTEEMPPNSTFGEIKEYGPMSTRRLCGKNEEKIRLQLQKEEKEKKEKKEKEENDEETIAMSLLMKPSTPNIQISVHTSASNIMNFRLLPTASTPTHLEEVRRSVASYVRYVPPNEMDNSDKTEAKKLEDGWQTTSNGNVTKTLKRASIGILSETNMILSHANNVAKSGYYDGQPVLRVTRSKYSPRSNDGSNSSLRNIKGSTGSSQAGSLLRPWTPAEESVLSSVNILEERDVSGVWGDPQDISTDLSVTGRSPVRGTTFNVAVVTSKNSKTSNIEHQTERPKSRIRKEKKIPTWTPPPVADELTIPKRFVKLRK